MTQGTVHYAIFNPESLSIPDGYKLTPHGLLHQVVKEEKNSVYKLSNVWRYYTSESFRDFYEKDFLNRQLIAHYHFRLGRYLVMSGDTTDGLKHVRDASRIGYDDYGVHFMVASFLADMELFDEARIELDRAGLNAKEPKRDTRIIGAIIITKRGSMTKPLRLFKKRPTIVQITFSIGRTWAMPFICREKRSARRRPSVGHWLLIRTRSMFDEFMKAHGLKAHSGAVTRGFH